MIDVQIMDDEDLEVIISPTDVRGNKTNVDGASIRITSNNVKICGDGVVTDAEGPDYIAICPGGVSGECILTVTADADLGDGVEEITDTINVVVSAVKATALGLSARGIPRAVPEPEPVP